MKPTPDYATDGIHLYEFDEDGILSPRDKRHDRTRDTSEDAAEGVLDNPVETEVELKTKEGKLKETVRPDLMVLAPGFKVPELMLEILSKTTADTDLDGKFRLYEALGVSEYLLYDLGDKRSKDSPEELLMYRLTALGMYKEVPSDPPSCPRRKCRPLQARCLASSSACKWGHATTGNRWPRNSNGTTRIGASGAIPGTTG